MKNTFPLAVFVLLVFFTSALRGQQPQILGEVAGFNSNFAGLTEVDGQIIAISESIGTEAGAYAFDFEGSQNDFFDLSLNQAFPFAGEVKDGIVYMPVEFGDNQHLFRRNLTTGAILPNFESGEDATGVTVLSNGNIVQSLFVDGIGHTLKNLNPDGSLNYNFSSPFVDFDYISDVASSSDFGGLLAVADEGANTIYVLNNTCDEFARFSVPDSPKSLDVLPCGRIIVLLENKRVLTYYPSAFDGNGNPTAYSLQYGYNVLAGLHCPRRIIGLSDGSFAITDETENVNDNKIVIFSNPKEAGRVVITSIGLDYGQTFSLTAESTLNNPTYSLLASEHGADWQAVTLPYHQNDEVNYLKVKAEDESGRAYTSPAWQMHRICESNFSDVLLIDNAKGAALDGVANSSFTANISCSNGATMITGSTETK